MNVCINQVPLVFTRTRFFPVDFLIFFFRSKVCSDIVILSCFVLCHFILCPFNRCTFSLFKFNGSHFQPIKLSIIHTFKRSQFQPFTFLTLHTLKRLHVQPFTCSTACHFGHLQFQLPKM